jgi:hypothetical protein
VDPEEGTQRHGRVDDDIVLVGRMEVTEERDGDGSELASRRFRFLRRPASEKMKRGLAFLICET